MSLLPPDGARLCDLDERRRWLSRVEVVYALPRSGILLLVEARVSVAISAASVVLRAGDERLEQALDVPSIDRVAALWRELWVSDDVGEVDPDGRVLLLYHQGLLGPRYAVSSLAAVDALVNDVLG